MEKPTEKSDLEMIQAYVGGDESAFEHLLCRYKSKLYTFILLQVRDAYLAEDIFQETFIKVIDGLRSGKYSDQGKFISWVGRIAQNVVVDHFRREKRGSVAVDGYGSMLDFPDESAESKILHQQRDVGLRKIVQMLPDEQKEVLLMRYFCGMSFKDIASATGVGINTALGRMRYAINNMRRMIEKYNVVLDIG